LKLRSERGFDVRAFPGLRIEIFTHRRRPVDGDPETWGTRFRGDGSFLKLQVSGGFVDQDYYGAAVYAVGRVVAGYFFAGIGDVVGAGQ
jgi:hypothetical protein